MIKSPQTGNLAGRYDVAVLGGGLAGLTLALQCHQEIPAARIGILEKNSHPVPEAAFKVGESTVEVAAYYFAKVLGLEDHIRDQQLPKNGLRFFFRAGDNTAIERRLEVGGTQFPPTPSYQFDRGRFENYLAERCVSCGIDFLDQTTVKDVHLSRGRAPHRVSIVRGGKESVVECRWVADASGRAGILKRKLDLDRPAPHKANAVWFRVNARINVDDWSADPVWTKDHDWADPRWLSTNHLMGEGYWVWLIPLASGSTSIGIVADEETHPLSQFSSCEKALAWLDRTEPQCAEKIRAHQAEIQDFLAVKHYAMECKQVFSTRRWGIVGDAGYFLDPFYSPGSDFIAFGNTFLSELIRRDLAGRSLFFHAPLYDRLFRAFYRNTSVVFHDQYPLFGDHQVMPVKILWDWMIYWTIIGFNFMHGRTCDVTVYMRHFRKLKRLNDLNQFMQKFFRQWHDHVAPREANGTIDTSKMALITETNQALQDVLDDREYAIRFSENVRQMEELFWEIIDHAGVQCSVPFKRRKSQAKHQNGFRSVFDVTSQAVHQPLTDNQPLQEEKPTELSAGS